MVWRGLYVGKSVLVKLLIEAVELPCCYATANPSFDPSFLHFYSNVFGVTWVLSTWPLILFV